MFKLCLLEEGKKVQDSNSKEQKFITTNISPIYILPQYKFVVRFKKWSDFCWYLIGLLKLPESEVISLFR